MLVTYTHRFMRAVALDASVFEEVEHDPRAIRGAVATVLLATGAAGIGAGGWRGASAQTFTAFTLIALASWVIWAAVILEIGARVMPEAQTRATYVEVLRPLGFAAAPGVFMALAAFPVVTAGVFAAAAVWMLAAMVLAVRQALDFSTTRRAILVCALGWMIAMATAVTLGLVLSRPVY